jgi:hypothetical protein
MSKSAESRTKEVLEKQGFIVEDCRSYNPFSKTRKDLFGIADLIALHSDRADWPFHPILIQCTVGTDNGRKRERKILNADNIGPISNSFIIQVWAWRKLKTKGNRWVPRVTELMHPTKGDLYFDESDILVD